MSVALAVCVCDSKDAVAHPYCWSDPCCSLDSNYLCGVDKYGRGTFTTVGITALSEGIKQCKTLVSLR